MVSDDMAQRYDASLVILAPILIDGQSMLLGCRVELFQVGIMLFLLVPTDCDVIYVGVGVLQAFTVDDVIWDLLEAGHPTGNPKWNPCKLKQSFAHFKGSVHPLFSLQRYLMIS